MIVEFVSVVGRVQYGFPRGRRWGDRVPRKGELVEFTGDREVDALGGASFRVADVHWSVDERGPRQVTVLLRR